LRHYQCTMTMQANPGVPGNSKRPGIWVEYRFFVFPG
jgi:hypothetical protein